MLIFKFTLLPNRKPQKYFSLHVQTHRLHFWSLENEHFCHLLLNSMNKFFVAYKYFLSKYRWKLKLCFNDLSIHAEPVAPLLWKKPLQGCDSWGRYQNPQKRIWLNCHGDVKRAQPSLNPLRGYSQFPSFSGAYICFLTTPSLQLSSLNNC